MPRPFTVLTPILMLAACSPAEEAGTEALDGTVEQISPAALHAVLLEEATTVTPADWTTGEPADETARAEWHVPPTLEGLRSVSECAELPRVDGGYDCTLILGGPDLEAGAGDPQDVDIRYRMEVGVLESGGLTLMSPNVRWTVRGAD